jgi:hypothetical protein
MINQTKLAIDAAQTVAPSEALSTIALALDKLSLPPDEKLTIQAAQASGYQVDQGRVPEHAIDGDLQTNWAALGMPQWITLDLGTTHLTSKTRISFHNYNAGRIYNYSVMVSLDNESWTTVANNELSGSTQWTELTFNPIEARYVRITLNSSNDSGWANIHEIEIHGHTNASENIITNRVLTLSWNPNPDEILGYRVYYGSTEDLANIQIMDISIASTDFDPLAPSVELNTWDDLGVTLGNDVCFRLRAYTNDSLSDFSSPKCMTIL